MADKLITAMTVSKNIHGYIALTRDTASRGANGHKMNAISSCIFARAITAGILLSGVLKNSQDKLVLSWDCTGPVKKILVETGANGEARGFVENTNLELIDRSVEGEKIRRQKLPKDRDFDWKNYVSCIAMKKLQQFHIIVI